MMQPSANSTENRFNEASVRLPAALADKSMQMYMLADGSKGFNIVVSRSEVEAGETLQAFTDRLLAVARRTLTNFNLADRRDCTVAGVAGVEMTFTWRANGTVLHQQQAIFLAPGAESGKPSGLVITGTSQGALTPRDAELFEKTVNSLSWRYPPQQALTSDADAASSEIPFERLPYVFGLSKRNRVLYVFDSQHTAHTEVDPDDVKSGVWRFFDASGKPQNATDQSRVLLGEVLNEIAGTDYICSAGSSTQKEALRNHLTQYRSYFSATRHA